MIGCSVAAARVRLAQQSVPACRSLGGDLPGGRHPPPLAEPLLCGSTAGCCAVCASQSRSSCCSTAMQFGTSLGRQRCCRHEDVAVPAGLRTGPPDCRLRAPCPCVCHAGCCARLPAQALQPGPKRDALRRTLYDLADTKAKVQDANSQAGPRMPLVQQARHVAAGRSKAGSDCLLSSYGKGRVHAALQIRTRLCLLLPAGIPHRCLQERWGIEWDRLERELSPTTAEGKPAGDDLLSELCGHLAPILLGRWVWPWAGGHCAKPPVNWSKAIFSCFCWACLSPPVPPLWAALHPRPTGPCRFGMTNSEFTDIPDVFNVAARHLSPKGPAGAPFIERVLQPFSQARAACPAGVGLVCATRQGSGRPLLANSTPARAQRAGFRPCAHRSVHCARPCRPSASCAARASTVAARHRASPTACARWPASWRQAGPVQTRSPQWRCSC